MRIIRSLLLLSATLSVAACTGASTPQQTSSSTPDTTAVSTSSSLPSLEETLSRLAAGSAPLSSDLRFLLPSEEDFDLMFSAYLKDGTLAKDAVSVPETLDDQVSPPSVATPTWLRTWSNPGVWEVSSSAMFSLDKTQAAAYADRLVAAVRSYGVEEFSDPEILFVTDYASGVSSDALPCVSLAVGRLEGLVVFATVKRADCSTSVPGWSAQIVKMALTRAGSVLR